MNALSGRKLTIADLSGDHIKAFTPPPEPPPEHPPEPTSKPRDPKWAAIEQLIKDLVELYPVFDAHHPKPLAIGTFEAILADLGCDPAVLARALRYWCHSARYLVAICANDHRNGLDGTPCGEVTPEQRLHAREALKTASNARHQHWR
jgi:sRNA-binding protein